MKLNKQTLYLLIIISGTAGASNPSLFKIALESLNSGTIVVLRYIFTLAVFVGYIIVRYHSIRWDNIRKSLAVSLLLAVNAITFAIAIRHLQASSAPLLYNIIPLLVAITSWLILKEKMGHSKIIGLVVGFAGVGLVASVPYIHQSQQLNFSLTAVLLVLLGSVTFAFYSVLAKPIQQKISPSEMMISISITTLISQIIYMWLINEPFSAAGATGRSLVATLGIAAIGTVLFWGLYQYILKQTTPTAASVMIYVQPAAGAIWALILLGDRLSWLALLGGIVSIIGIAQVNGLLGQLRRKYMRA